MFQFENLKMRRRDDGVEYGREFFDNGYGISVVRGLVSYGAHQGLYELAVLKGTAAGWKICHTTPITDGVFGYLTPEDVTRIGREVEELAE